MNITEKYKDLVIEHNIYLDRYIAYLIVLMNKKISYNDNKIIKELRNIKNSDKLKLSDYRVLKAYFKDYSNGITEDIEKEYQKAIKKFAKKENDWFNALILTLLPLTVKNFYTKLDNKAIEKIIGLPIIENKTMQQLMKEWSKAKQDKFIRILATGYSKNWNTSEIYDKIVGSKDLSFKDGLIKKSSKQILATIRTGITAIENNIKIQNYKQNSKLIKGVQWSSILDDRTTLICINLDGKIDLFDGSVKELNGLVPPAHWACYHKDTKVMTDKGWKYFYELTEDDKFISFNPENHLEQEYIKSNKLIRYHYNGQMINFKTNDFDMCVTPNHNMTVMYRRNPDKKFRFVEAKDLPKTDNRIYRGLNWKGEEPEYVELGGYKLKPELYCKLMGSKLRNIHTRDKYVPDNIMRMSKRLIIMFLNAYMLSKNSKSKNRKLTCTSSARMANDLSELILKAGGRPSVKVINKTNYVTNIIRWNTNLYSVTDKIKRNYIDYNDMVYCVELNKWHTLLIEYNGKVGWSGNCRSSIVPIFKSANEIGVRLSRKEKDYMNGFVPKTEVYAEWFERQPTAVKKKVLGEARYELYKEGKYKVTQFSNGNIKYNLDELS